MHYLYSPRGPRTNKIGLPLARSRSQLLNTIPVVVEEEGAGVSLGLCNRLGRGQGKGQVDKAHEKKDKHLRPHFKAAKGSNKLFLRVFFRRRLRLQNHKQLISGENPENLDIFEPSTNLKNI